MGKFKEKLYRFFYGRYGTDQLYKFCLILLMLLLVASLVLQFTLPEGLASAIVSLSISVLTYALMFWMIFRSMSRNIYKRRRENERYLKISGAVKRFFIGNTSRKTRSANRDDQYYIFRDCTRCKATLRLPRKKGKHSVKCPRCSHSFYVRSK
ncbi:MAG: hypothetical protein IJD74_03420 [Clostridia bacterium]|nr:hypothetical protein [Clostridia bacterium]